MTRKLELMVPELAGIAFARVNARKESRKMIGPSCCTLFLVVKMLLESRKRTVNILLKYAIREIVTEKKPELFQS